jgi:HEAT repeat protein
MRWLVILMIASCSAKPDLLTSANAEERREAVKALGHSSDRRAAIEKLAPILRSDPDEQVRREAALALGALGPPETTSLLVEAAQSLDTVAVRAAALYVLEKTRDPAAIPGMIAIWRLERNLDDFGAAIPAAHVLRGIGRPAIEPLLAVAFDRKEPYSVRSTALMTLKRMPDPSIPARVAPLLEDPNYYIRYNAQAVIDAHSGAPPQ